MTLLQAKGLLHRCPAQNEPRLQRLGAFLADEPRAIALGWYERRPWRPRKRLSTRSPGSHSHSIVPGGLLVMSKQTRLTPLTSFTMRLASFSSRAGGDLTQPAVIPSWD